VVGHHALEQRTARGNLGVGLPDLAAGAQIVARNRRVAQGGPDDVARLRLIDGMELAAVAAAMLSRTTQRRRKMMAA
jgi:hypothetical protein